MRRTVAGRWAFGVLVGLMGALLIGSVGEAGVRVGGGAGIIDDGAAPVARLAFDVLPLWFVNVAIDTEVWLVSDGGPWMMPFLAVSTPILFKATVGVAPLIEFSDGGASIPPNVAAIKAGVSAPVGPLELFGEAIFFVLPGAGVPDELSDLGRPIFAFGVTLGF